MIQSEKSPTHARQSRRTLTFYSQLAHSSVKNQVTGSGNDIHALLYTQPHQVLLVRSHSILGQLFSGKSANSIGNFGKTIGSLGWLGLGVGAVRISFCLDWGSNLGLGGGGPVCALTFRGQLLFLPKNNN